MTHLPEPPAQPTPGAAAAPPPMPAAATPARMPVRAFFFDGGAGTYLGTAIGAFLITLGTIGFGLPWAVCLRYKWRTKHTYVNGHRLLFNGTGGALFGTWIKWWLLTIVTAGIYSFWVGPRLTKWIVEHQEFDPRAMPA